MTTTRETVERTVTIVGRDALISTLADIVQLERGRIADVFVTDERSRTARFVLHVMCSVPGRGWVELNVELAEDEPVYPSLARSFPLAGWYEREIAERFGIRPDGHPNPAPLFSSPAREVPQLAEAPLGIVDYPLGPVRSGVVESTHYTLRTVGEELVDCGLQVFYKHRGIEELAQGLPIEHATLLAERISGTSSFNNSLAFVRAYEATAAAAVPERARFLRTLFAELERVYNHLSAFADLAQATGLTVAQAQFEILKERQLRLNASLAGHRYLFGLNVPGGLTRDVDATVPGDIRHAYKALRHDLGALEAMYLGTPSHVDRLERTGILTHADAVDFGAVGPIARASGVDRDARCDHPFAAYHDVDFAVPVERHGDAMARTRVRFAEVRESIRIVEQVCDRLPEGPVRADVPMPSAGSSGFGWAESPHGETLAWVTVGDEGRLRSFRARPASFANWQAFAVAIPGHNILTDFPVIEQSFNLSVAGANR